MALEISQANAVSRQYFEKALINIAYDNCPFFKKLKKGNQVKVKGGTHIQWPIRYTAMSGNGAVKGVDPAAPVTYGVGDSRTAAKSAWKYYFGSTQINWQERVENVGEAQIVSLLKDKYVELQEDYEDKMAKDLYSTATYNESCLDMISPLTFLVSDRKYAGIDPADAPNWRSKVYGGIAAAAWVASTVYALGDVVMKGINKYQCIQAGTSASSGGPAGTGSNITDSTVHWKYVDSWTVLDLYSDDTTKGKKSLYKAIVASTFGGKKPKFLLTTEDILATLKEKIWLATKYEGTTDKETADMGFTNVTFEGTTILADPFCPAGYLFGLDMNAFEFQIHPDFNFKTDDWAPLENYPNNLVKKMSFSGNTVMRYRHTSFAFNGLTGIEKAA
jgi:hypothetical protein